MNWLPNRKFVWLLDFIVFDFLLLYLFKTKLKTINNSDETCTMSVGNVKLVYTYIKYSFTCRLLRLSFICFKDQMLLDE